MDLRTIDLYLKRRALAESPGNANERATARRQAEEMEGEHPGIRRKAEAVARAMSGGPGAVDTGAETAAGWGGGLASFLKATAQAAAGEAASRFADDVSGVERYTELKRRDVVFTEHDCAEGQVCLEVRVRVDDLLKVRTRERILSEIEDELMELAED